MLKNYEGCKKSVTGNCRREQLRKCKGQFASFQTYIT